MDFCTSDMWVPLSCVMMKERMSSWPSSANTCGRREDSSSRSNEFISDTLVEADGVSALINTRNRSTKASNVAHRSMAVTCNRGYVKVGSDSKLAGRFRPSLGW